MRQADDCRRGRHVVAALNVQLVFVTKYRRGVLTGAHLGTLRGVFASVGADFGAELVELDGEDDRVHLFVAYPPQVAVARLVNSLKGVSARRLRQRYRVRTHREHL
jgi:putative transposase